MSLVSENIKYLRKKIGLTQEQMAERLGIKRSLLGAYEEGRADPRISNLIRFAEIFDITVDQIIGADLITGNPIKDNGDASGNKFSRVKVLTISVDSSNRENIELVPQKAAAGYLNGYADPEYIEELPKFQLPMLSGNATYRAFEINGDSMLPLVQGTVIVGQYVENIEDIRNGNPYVMVTLREGIVFKRIYRYKDDNSKISLVSDNKAYEPYDIRADELLEIWEAKSYISNNFPTHNEGETLSLKKLADIVIDIQQELIKLKDK